MPQRLTLTSLPNRSALQWLRPRRTLLDYLLARDLLLARRLVLARGLLLACAFLLSACQSSLDSAQSPTPSDGEGKDGGPHGVHDASGDTASPDACAWPAAAFFGHSVLTPPSLAIELGQRAAALEEWQSLVPGALLPMYHGAQGSFHSFAMFRIALPGGHKAAVDQPLKIRTEVWLADGCQTIAVGRQPTAFVWPVDGDAEMVGNTEHGELGVQVYFDVPSYQSSAFDGLKTTLYVRVLVVDTAEWGEAAVPVVLKDTRPAADQQDVGTAFDAASAADVAVEPDVTAQDADDATAEVSDVLAAVPDAVNSMDSVSGPSADTASGDADLVDSAYPADGTAPLDAGSDASGASDVVAAEVGVIPTGYSLEEPENLLELPAFGLKAFAAPPPLALSGLMRCAASGYLDSDNHLDAVVVGQASAGGLRTAALLARPGVHEVVQTDLPDLGTGALDSCVAVDLDDDNIDDLLVTSGGGLRALRNDGDGHFQDAAWLLSPGLAAGAWSVAPVDIDGDADLDLLAGGRTAGGACTALTCAGAAAQQACASEGAAKTADPGAAKEVANRVLIRTAQGFVEGTNTWLEPLAVELASFTPLDTNGDGTAELLYADRLASPRLVRRAGDHYSASLLSPLQSVAQRTGWGLIDLNGDGAAELLASGAGGPVVFSAAPATAAGWQPQGAKLWSFAAITQQTESWSPLIADWDNDGVLDAYLAMAADGQPLQSVESCPDVQPVSDLLVLGKPAGTSQQARRGIVHTCGQPGPIAQSAVDLDLDGRLDLVQVRGGCAGAAELHILRNNTPKKSAVTIRVVGPPGNRDALGATVRALIGGVWRQQVLSATAGPGSSGARAAHFGLPAGQLASKVEVVYPDKAKVALTDVAPGGVQVVQWAPPEPAPAVDLGSLPKASWHDVTAQLGLPQNARWELCVGLGRVDAGPQDDLILLGVTAQNQRFVWTKPLGAGLGGTPTLQYLAPGPVSPDLGCTVLDIESDGDDDLVVSGSSGAALLRNTGGQFAWDEDTLEPLLGVRPMSIALADFDRDGDLDLFVGREVGAIPCDGYSCVEEGMQTYCTFNKVMLTKTPLYDRLLVQTAPGVYSDATKAWGIPQALVATRAVPHDFDGDGWMDVLVGNDFEASYVLRNTGTGKLQKVEVEGIQPYSHAMGWATGDLDEDGDIDLVQADIGPAEVYLRLPAPLPGASLPAYPMIAAGHPLVGLTRNAVQWEPLVGDLDLNGQPDIFFGVSMDLGKIALDKADSCATNPAQVGAPDLWLQRNSSGGWTASRTDTAKCGSWGSLTQTLVDLDTDGDLDLVQVRPGCANDYVVRALRNDLSDPGVTLPKTVRVQLVGKAGNPRAYGARIRAMRNGKLVQREVTAGGLHSSAAPQALHFGGGHALQDVYVRWPDGKWTQHGTLEPGQLHVLKE